ncbi:MAG: TonB-dependent receptor [Acidobacteria bacterium]|nr:TonB-dependent receptor [Acidobacteriota bacterium]NIM60347.1 TonB-dependent receptor [Acidobacteriota bacterium]NIO60348.1 TonB-dependent receptor [Acidobacteriota bacterium]NIQ31403.1 TonB-dependent receptor [Acidobacteriota bacterium]NIQ86629.1 TonB-dependent receptor [Acidobacteriota bacterium]
MLRLFSSVSSLLLLIAVAPATAEEPDPTPLDSGYSEQVSVTAARTPIPVNETGNSISILTREQIEERGHVFLADLLRGLPGLSTSRSGPVGSQTQIRVRGAEANHVLIRIDGVDVSDAFGADELPLEILTSDDIERIEFVRGPQSGLWGSDAVAGVINILTRSDAGTGGSVRLEAGSFGTLRAGGRYARDGERVRFEANVSRVDSDGTNISRQGTEDDGTSNTTAGASVRFTPSAPVDVELSARHTDSSSDFDTIDFVNTGLPIDAANSTDTDLTVIQLSGRWQPQTGRWTHEGRLSSVVSAVATELGGVPDTSTEIDKLGISLQSAVDLGRGEDPRRHGLAFAVDHERRDFSQRGSASPFGDPNQDQEIDNTGVAVEYRFRVRDRWAASANVRHEGNSDFDDVTSFRLTGTYGVAGGKTRLRAALGTGQKAPTFIERFGFFPGSFIGNPKLKPERSRSYEVGVDRQFGESGTLGITYFRAQLEDEINGFFFDTTAGGFTAVNETGESDRAGIELLLIAPIGERIDLQVGYTFTDSTQPDGAGGNERELRRPRHLGSFAANWRSMAGRFALRGGLYLTGDATDVFFPPFPNPPQRVALDSYLLGELHARFRLHERFELFGRVENLFDETFEDVYGFRGSGTAAYAGVGFSAAD